MGFITAAAAFIPHKTYAAAASALYQQRQLTLYNIHSDEYLKTVYWKDGKYLPDALAEINYILRDRNTGKIKAIALDLLDLLSAMQQTIGSPKPLHVVSGYRTPRSNAYLKKTTKGVARNSLHMYGKAVDVRLPGGSLDGVRRIATTMRKGGVGYYPSSNFIHVDVGTVRYWTG
jgi:uncharacterized protein YcbK (DUF882 family)